MHKNLMQHILCIVIAACFFVSSATLVAQGDILSLNGKSAGSQVNCLSSKCANGDKSASVNNDSDDSDSDGSDANSNANANTRATTNINSNNLPASIKTQKASAKTATKKISKKACKKHKKKKKMTRKRLVKAIGKAKDNKKISGFGGAKFNKKCKAGKKLVKALKKTRKGGKTCVFLMVDIKTGKGVCSNANKKVYGASTIKAPYVAAICKYRPKSIDSSAKHHIREVMSWSSNEDYRALRLRFGSKALSKFKKYSNAKNLVTSTTWVTYSPKTLSKLWAGQYWYLFKKTNKHSKWLRTYYKKGANSFIKSALKNNKYRTTYTKAGWCTLSGKGWIYNDAGIIRIKNKHPYLLVVMSEHNCSKTSLKEFVKAADKYHTYMVKSEK